MSKIIINYRFPYEIMNEDDIKKIKNEERKSEIIFVDQDVYNVLRKKYEPEEMKIILKSMYGKKINYDI